MPALIRQRNAQSKGEFILNENKGKVFKYPDNVDTDVIIPARYLNITDMQFLSRHCMEDIDSTFIKNVMPGDVIVAGNNFGCGSSREHAPAVIKAAGIQAVIAKSFARIFYRNAINIGLPILECPEAVEVLEAGNIISVDFDTGKIIDHTLNKIFYARPFPDFIKNIIDKGGLLCSM